MKCRTRQTQTLLKSRARYASKHCSKFRGSQGGGGKGVIFSSEWTNAEGWRHGIYCSLGNILDGWWQPVCCICSVLLMPGQCSLKDVLVRPQGSLWHPKTFQASRCECFEPSTSSTNLSWFQQQKWKILSTLQQQTWFAYLALDIQI